VPYSFINLPRGQNQQLILLVTAHCGGKANTMEAICTVVVP
jgi:hypothetical protein